MGNYVNYVTKIPRPSPTQSYKEIIKIESNTNYLSKTTLKGTKAQSFRSESTYLKIYYYFLFKYHT